MDKDSQSTSGVRAALGVGLATLITVLVAVLLTTFSVLALVTARGDLSLSNKTAEAMESYYEADGQAEEWLSELDGYMSSGQTNLSNNLGRAGYELGLTKDGKTTVSETFDIDNNRELSVEIMIDNYPQIEILKWQVTAKAQQLQ